MEVKLKHTGLAAVRRARHSAFFVSTAVKLVTQESRVAVSTVGTVQPSSTLAEQLLRVAIVSVVLESLKKEIISPAIIEIFSEDSHLELLLQADAMKEVELAKSSFLPPLLPINLLKLSILFFCFKKFAI